MRREQRLCACTGRCWVKTGLGVHTSLWGDLGLLEQFANLTMFLALVFEVQTPDSTGLILFQLALQPSFESEVMLCRKGMDLYFKRHDGQAVTCDDFRNAMADANHKDLSSFAAWWATCPSHALHLAPQNVTVLLLYPLRSHSYV